MLAPILNSWLSICSLDAFDLRQAKQQLTATALSAYFYSSSCLFPFVQKSKTSQPVSLTDGGVQNWQWLVSVAGVSIRRSKNSSSRTPHQSVAGLQSAIPSTMGHTPFQIRKTILRCEACQPCSRRWAALLPSLPPNQSVALPCQFFPGSRVVVHSSRSPSQHAVVCPTNEKLGLKF